MIDEAIASAELAQPAWTYPICAMCGAAVLSIEQLLDEERLAEHFECPDVEDLDSLPLVERAAIACSAIACDDGKLWWSDVDLYFGEGAARLTDRAFDKAYGKPWREREFASALAEAMIRTGEVTP